ncbi:hypothetical protein Pcinc_012355 [Petrolisthes cinctipes]|uniref:Uncharacterized protein n=1 Tax=Petrolisthes cinctipes TaxID=88211 RepID=A0AAE1FZ53_PETCI|nr:hypothetical protein Pcinc_012355 [Petrolisthes cinctipes]
MRCRSFLSTASAEVRKRWEVDDKMMLNIRFLSPRQALSLRARDICPSITPLVQSASNIISIDDLELVQALDDQWRRLPLVTIPEEITKKTILTFSGEN